MRRMRGDDRQPDSMFSYVSAEQRVPKDHPLRAIGVRRFRLVASLVMIVFALAFPVGSAHRLASAACRQLRDVRGDAWGAVRRLAAENPATPVRGRILRRSRARWRAVAASGARRSSAGHSD